MRLVTETKHNRLGRVCVRVRVFVGHAAQPLWYMCVCVAQKGCACARRGREGPPDDSAVEGTTKALV